MRLFAFNPAPVERRRSAFSRLSHCQDRTLNRRLFLLFHDFAVCDLLLLTVVPQLESMLLAMYVFVHHRSVCGANFVHSFCHLPHTYLWTGHFESVRFLYFLYRTKTFTLKPKDFFFRAAQVEPHGSVPQVSIQASLGYALPYELFPKVSAVEMRGICVFFYYAAGSAWVEYG